jgi:glycosyltransferase involved in cell wall biosynthesis
MLISATIITFNEERNLARAIESLRCCDEILVVDSGSTDQTVELALRHGARVVRSEWRGYAAQKNYAASEATHDWILSIDADEALSEELEAEILQLKQRERECDAYRMPRLARYLGKWILYSGWYPDAKIRLYDRRAARWTGDYVHESVVCQGTVRDLRGNLLHYTCASLSEHLSTLDRYTTLAADELRARGRIAGARHLALDPLWSFVRSYVVKRGWKDGVHGFVIAWMAALYTFLKHAKTRLRPR